jgi:hypothetical protein
MGDSERPEKRGRRRRIGRDAPDNMEGEVMNGRKHLARFGWIGAACGAALFAAACGGGGGGGGGGNPASSGTNLGAYSGTTTPVAITAASGTAVASKALNLSNLNDPVLAAIGFAKAGDGTASAGDLVRRLAHRGHHPGLLGLRKSDGSARGAAKFTEFCNGVDGTDGTYDVDDGTSSTTGLGTYKEIYHNCDFGAGAVITGGTYSDQYTQLSFSGTGDVVSYRDHESYDYQVAAAGDDYSFRLEADYDGNVNQLVENTTGTLELWNDTAETGFSLQGAKVKDTYSDPTGWDDGCTHAESWSGRIFDGDTGYVDAETTSPLVYTTDDCSAAAGPSSGGPIVLTGDAPGKAVVTPLSDNLAEVAVDEDGDGTPDVVTDETWASLGF